MHDEIGFLIRRIGRLWRREADQALADHGLSQATALPLVVLLRWGNAPGKGSWPTRSALKVLSGPAD